jgi:hypothetical protein
MTWGDALQHDDVQTVEDPLLRTPLAKDYYNKVYGEGNPNVCARFECSTDTVMLTRRNSCRSVFEKSGRWGHGIVL